MKTQAVILFAVLFMFGCSKKPEKSFFREGGYYSSKNEKGKYDIIKILVIDDHAFHVRIYANKFDSVPKDSDIDSLTLGGIGKPEGFGIGHAPMAKGGFKESEYHFIGFRKVKKDELVGYEIWNSQ